MQFIETLKLKSKLFFLFLLITLGLISLGIMGAINISSMKKNLDDLYFGSLVPVTELNEILQSYHSGLVTTVYKVKSNEISPSQTVSMIESSILKINRVWSKYELHFKRSEELQYVEYVASEILSTNNYFYKIMQAITNKKDMSRLSLSYLEKKTSHIDSVIHKLIKYEVEIANYERKEFTKNYESSNKRLIIMYVLIIVALLLISFYVFKSIQNDHSELEVSTKKLKRANKKLENVSYTDSLTSLFNRRYFNLVYERELKISKRTHSYITFMMLDIDYFKQYNDTYGHIEGDNTLKSVAKILSSQLKRPSDYVFRLGGEEFGILLTDTDETYSAKIARDICDAVRDEKIDHSSSDICEYVTISIGVVCCIADDALNDEILISRSDEMLYKAKETGRDRYMITSEASVARARVIEDLSA